MASALGGGLSGAASGAAAGAAFGPYGAAAGAIIGGILGALKGSKQKKAFEKQSQEIAGRAEFEFGQTIRRAEIQDLLARREGAAAVGATRADVGAAGLRAGGSANDLLRQTRRDIEFTRQLIEEEKQAAFKRTRFAAATATEQARAGQPSNFDYTAQGISAAGTLLGQSGGSLFKRGGAPSTGSSGGGGGGFGF